MSDSESSSAEEPAPTQLELRVAELSKLITSNKEIASFWPSEGLDAKKIALNIRLANYTLKENLVDSNGRTSAAWTALRQHLINCRRDKSTRKDTPIELPERLLDNIVMMFNIIGRSKARSYIDKLDGIALSADTWLTLMNHIEFVYDRVINYDA